MIHRRSYALFITLWTLHTLLSEKTPPFSLFRYSLFRYFMFRDTKNHKNISLHPACSPRRSYTAKRHLKCRFELRMICNHPSKPSIIDFRSLQNYKFCDIPSGNTITAQLGLLHFVRNDGATVSKGGRRGRGNIRLRRMLPLPLRFLSRSTVVIARSRFFGTEATTSDQLYQQGCR